MAARDLDLRYPAVPSRSRLHMAPGALRRLGSLVRSTLGARRVAIVSDSNVAPHHAARTRAALSAAGVASDLVVVPAGERTKRPPPLIRLWDQLASLGIGRRDALVALGGGVVGDLAGFAAATWLRGIAWVGVPTSVMAQVDSSVGGKTGIDLDLGKNLVGAFHQPTLVVVDPELLATLPARERRAGLAEVVKMGMAVDASLFRWIERHTDALADGEPAALARAVERALRAKVSVVRHDEREREGGRRTALNYGHTVAHALESARRYRGVRHGEAVAIGMRVAAELSVRSAGLDPGVRDRQNALLERLGLPRRMPPTPIAALLSAMRHDKKRGAPASGTRRAAKVRWVLTTRMGHASVPRPIDARFVRAALIDVGARV